jgi:hypothetical protein
MRQYWAWNHQRTLGVKHHDLTIGGDSNLSFKKKSFVNKSSKKSYGWIQQKVLKIIVVLIISLTWEMML